MTTFDALAAARDLEGAGMERRQAEAVAAACRGAASAGSDAATKADLAAAIAPLATKAELAELKAAMTVRMVAIALAVNGAFAALIVGLLVAVLDRLP